jgi:hypothetical protein
LTAHAVVVKNSREARSWRSLEFMEFMECVEMDGWKD